MRLRGYIENPQATETEEECWGNNGALTIIRDDGYNRPFVGACILPENAGLDEGFEEYFRISEQLPTRIQTVVDIVDGECRFAAVIAVQPLPFADEEVLEKVRALDLERLLNDCRAQNVFDCARAHFGQAEVWEERKAAYKCNCSRRYLTRVLVSLGETQMREIIKEDGAVRVHCHYCNTDYEFTDEDADLLFPKENI